MSIPSANATVVNCENHAEFPGGAGLPAEQNLTQIKGVAVSTNAGASDAGTQRTIEANDSPLVTGGAAILAQSTATAASVASLNTKADAAQTSLTAIQGSSASADSKLSGLATWMEALWDLLALVWTIVKNWATGAGAANATTLRTVAASDSPEVTGLSNVTPPDPGAAETITPILGADPVTGECVAIAIDTREVTVEGSVVANAGTVCRLVLYGEPRDTGAIAAIPGADFTSMETAGAWKVSIQPSPVGMHFAKIGARQYFTDGGADPVFTMKMRQRK